MGKPSSQSEPPCYLYLNRWLAIGWLSWICLVGAFYRLYHGMKLTTKPTLWEIFFQLFPGIEESHRKFKILEFDPKTSKKNSFFLKFHRKFQLLMADGVIIDLCQNNFKCDMHLTLSVEVVLEELPKIWATPKKIPPPPFFRKKFRGLIEKRGLAGADPGGGMKGLGVGKRGKE